jgi:hypothetical protein
MNFNKEKKILDDVVYNYFIGSRAHDDPLSRDYQDPDAAFAFNTNTLEDLYNRFSYLGLQLAGGAINSIFTGRGVKDLDFYMAYPETKDECIAIFTKYFGEPYFKSPNAISWKRKAHGSRSVFHVQLITRFIGSPREIFDWFDFTIVQGSYDFIYRQFEFGDRFFQDVAARRLVYCGKSKYPICAMYRTKKYMARGYTCPGSTIMHISLSIVRLEIKTYKDLKEQLMGIDTAYLQDLLNQEKYNDSLPVDYGVFLADALSSINGYDMEDLLDDEA